MKIVLAMIMLAYAGTLSARTLDLAGDWRVKGEGIDATVRLPGTLADHKLGRHFTAEDWRGFTDRRTKGALTREYQYRGRAVYSREIEFNDDDVATAKREGGLELLLERVMWRSDARLDGESLGRCDRLSTPHRHRIPARLVTPGRHRLEVEVDNSNLYGFSEWSHAYGPVMQSVWHGLLGRLEIGAPRRKGPPVAMRKVSTDGRKILIDGKPLFLRGNVDCCHFPRTGAPSFDVGEWRRIFTAMKEDGVNAIRFHSWCPPEAAFAAADEMDIYLMPEAGIWADGWNTPMADRPGRGGKVDQFIRAELDAILDEYGDHPCFLTLGIGNEFATGKDGCNWEKLDSWMRELKRRDPRRLYMIASGRGYVTADGKGGDDFSSCGWVAEPGNSFAHTMFASGAPFPAGTRGNFEPAFSKAHIPTLRHEAGQWVVFPLREELRKYDGVLRAFDREEFVRRLDASGLARHERLFHNVSARMNRMLYQEDVESYLRTPSCAGLQLLSAQDFSGQGEALVGWRDSFWDLKPGFQGLPPFRDILSDVAFLARFDDACLVGGDVMSVDLQVRNLTLSTIPAGTSWKWSCFDTNGTVRLERALEPDELRTVATLAVNVPNGPMRGEFRFGSNRWNVFAFPRLDSPMPVPSSVTVTAEREVALSQLAAGGRVVYTGPTVGSGKGSFRSVFWSAAWFQAGAGAYRTLGSAVDAAHPMLKGFPTDFWTDRQWRRLCDRSQLHPLEWLPKDFEPVVRAVPDFHHPTSLGSLFEMRCGKGRLIVCGFPLDGGSVEERAFRKSLLAYAASEAFAPKSEVDVAALRSHLLAETPLQASVPKEHAGAKFYVECAARLQVNGSSRPWKRDVDSAYLPDGSYAVTAGGVWRDATGAYWHGKPLRMVLKGVPPTRGVLKLRFCDPNHLRREGVVSFEGRTAVVPKHDGGTVWVSLPVQAEDFLDGEAVIEAVPTKGPNLMVDRVVFTP